MQWENCGADAESNWKWLIWEESGPSSEMQMQVLRLTTPKLKNARGSFR